MALKQGYVLWNPFEQRVESIFSPKLLWCSYPFVLENKILAPLGWGYPAHSFGSFFFSPPSEQFWEFGRGGPEESQSALASREKVFFPEYIKTRASRLWLTPLHFYPGVIFHGKSSTFSVWHIYEKESGVCVCTGGGRGGGKGRGAIWRLWIEEGERKKSQQLFYRTEISSPPRPILETQGALSTPKKNFTFRKCVA